MEATYAALDILALPRESDASTSSVLLPNIPLPKNLLERIKGQSLAGDDSSFP